MKFRAVAVALALTLGAATAGSASADPLHGFCSTANPCTDNGTNTPTSVNPPLFGFSAGGHDQTGDVLIKLLVPDNVTPAPSYTISGPFLGASTFTANEVSSTPWTSGTLADYLGLTASPSNPIGAYLPSTLAFQPSATGFFVFEADIGSRTLPSNSTASDADLMTTSPGLFPGSYVVAFQNVGDSEWAATANSGAIFETGRLPPPPSVPEPATWALMILGVGLTGFAARRRSAGFALSA